MNLEGLLCLHEPRDATTFADYRLGYSLQLIAIRDSGDATWGETRLAVRLLAAVANAGRSHSLAMIQAPKLVNRVYERLTK